VSGDPGNEASSERDRAAEERAAALRLRPERPRVTRLSRKTLAGGAAIILVAVAGSTIWALRSSRDRVPAPEELYSTDRRATADGLAGLPRDYAGIPRPAPPLGPPLPGDLGRPMLSAQGASSPGTPAVDPDAQRRTQEVEAARTSQLFATTSSYAQPQPVAQPPQTENSTQVQPGEFTSDEAFAQNGQDRKLAFVNAAVDRRVTSPDRLDAPASPYVVQAGSVIPAALVTGIRSDLPGQITAQVTENVYDSPTGRFLLIGNECRSMDVT
jgi:type IV secretion system protein TrbI